MITTRILISAITLFIMCGCNGTIKSTSTTTAHFATHKEIAILPFEVSFDLTKEEKQEFSAKELSAMRLDMSLQLQNYLYNGLKKYSYKHPFTTIIQNTYTTNEILGSRNISFATVFSKSKKGLCDSLGVDAVMAPLVSFSKGVMDMSIQIIDKTSDTILWQYNWLNDHNSMKFYSLNGTPSISPAGVPYPVPKNAKQEALNSSFALIDQTMEKFVKQFPYKKN